MPVMRRFVLSLAVMGSAFALQAQNAAQTTLTLEEAVQIATKNNPLHLVTANNRARAGALLRSARGNLLPNISSNFSAGYREGRPQSFAGQTFGSGIDVLSADAGLSVSLNLSRDQWLARKREAANVDATDAETRNSAANLRTQVINQYLTVLQAQARAVMQDTLLAGAQAQLALA